MIAVPAGFFGIAGAAPYVFAAANEAIAGIALGTIWLLLRGRLLPPRVAATPTS